MAALDDFLKQNVSGPLNKVFLAGYIRDISTAENKWKAVGKVIVEMAVWTSRLVLPAVFIAAWVKLGSTVRTILRDTGSLDAALRRLAAIQGLQRTFAPLLGGLSAAKQRVAELVQFTGRQKFFKFEDIGEGARSLEVMTRGIYSSNQALLEVQNAAVSSGNGFAETAKAVSEFYADLREGQPIDQAAERLRQMGVISNQTANFLDDLQKSGAGVQQVFGELRGALAGAKPAEAGEDLATIQQRQAEAAENLKRSFGAPFTHDEIQNTKNYTDAMNAIAPAVGRVASFFSVLTDGLSTVKSTIVKTAAESKPLQVVLEGLAKALGIVAAAGLLWGALQFPIILARWAAAFKGATGAMALFRVGLLGLSAATGIGAVLAVVGTAIGVFINYRRQQQEIAQRVKEMAQAHREAQEAIDQQSASVKTLAERNELLAKSMQQIIDLEKKKQDLLNQPAGSERDKSLSETKRALREAKEKQQAVLEESTGGLTGPEKETFIAAQIERTRAQRRSAFQAAITGEAPEGRLEVRRKEVAELKEEERQAESGLKAAMDVEQARSKLDDQIVKAQTKQRDAEEKIKGLQEQRSKAVEAVKLARISGQDTSQEDKALAAVESKIVKRNEEARAAQKETKLLEGQRAATGIEAPMDTSTFATEMAKRIRLMEEARKAAEKWDQAGAERIQNMALAGTENLPDLKEKIQKGTPQDIFNWQYYAAQQRQQEQNLPQKTEERQGEQATLRRESREMAMRRYETGLEVRGNVALARGETGQIKTIEDVRGFGEEYQRNIEAGMADKEARRQAMTVQQSRIAAEGVGPGPGVVASSLQRIGGGGGAYVPGGDPALRVLERQLRLNEEANTYLKAIADSKEGVH